MKTREQFFSKAILAGVLVAALAGCGGGGGGGKGGVSQPPEVLPSRGNLRAVHNSSSSQYDRDCQKCHEQILKRTTLDSRFPEAHQAMIPFISGQPIAAGVSNDTCIACHASVDFDNRSAASIRKQVDVEICAGCHGARGVEAQPFYVR